MKTGIGIQIKKVRKQRKMTLKQLAEKTGLSISFLSQIERSKSSMTLESLHKVSDALDISPSQFFSKSKDSDTPISGKETMKKQADSFFHYYSLIGSMANPLFEPRIVTLLPTEEKVSPFRHEGQEFIYILEGTLTLFYKDHYYELSVGDSFHFESTEAHNWINYSKATVKILQVVAKR